MKAVGIVMLIILGVVFFGLLGWYGGWKNTLLATGLTAAFVGWLYIALRFLFNEDFKE